jgi:hypothetical protein
MIEHPADKAPPHFASRRAHGEVPWRKRRHNANGLSQQGMSHPGLARYNTAVDTTTFLRVPFDDLAAAQDFQSRLGDRLPLLQSHRDGHVLEPLAHDPGSPKNNIRPLRRGGPRPQPKAVSRRGQGIVKIGARGMWDSAENASSAGLMTGAPLADFHSPAM